MELRIVIDRLDPLRGYGVLEGQEAWTFAGWMQLIENVERLKEESRNTEPDSPSGASA